MRTTGYAELSFLVTPHTCGYSYSHMIKTYILFPVWTDFRFILQGQYKCLYELTYDVSNL